LQDFQPRRQRQVAESGEQSEDGHRGIQVQPGGEADCGNQGK